MASEEEEVLGCGVIINEGREERWPKFGRRVPLSAILKWIAIKNV
jgi:hypothetical protein